jgi:cytochrome c-type biogenesis protein CcmH/NrfG
MRSESIAFAVAGVLFGLLAGWVIGTQQSGLRVPAATPAAATAAPAPTEGSSQAVPVDEARVTSLKDLVTRQPSDPSPRVQLGNIYFDAERFDEAITWYTDALKLDPSDVNVSTDLGVSYYYTNQPDRALEQFDRSLTLDPTHTKTILNMGIVKAFGKQDLEGAAAAWTKVVELAPDSPEGQAARGALERMRAAHAGDVTSAPTTP